MGEDKNYTYDFNEQFDNDEKECRIPWLWNHPRYLRDFMDSNFLCDLGFSGPKYTWENRREVEGLIRGHFDQSRRDNLWLQSWPNTIIHVEASYLDLDPTTTQSLLKLVQINVIKTPVFSSLKLFEQTIINVRTKEIEIVKNSWSLETYLHWP